MAFNLFDPAGWLGDDEGIFGALAGSEAIYGRKPRPVPAPTPADILNTSVSANIQAQPQIGQLQRTQQDQLLDLMERAAPGTAGARQNYVQNIISGLKGEVPQDVIDQIRRQGAAWKINSGTFGPPIRTNTGATIGDLRDLRHFGLASIQRQDVAGQQLENYTENLRKYAMPPLFPLLKPSYDPYAEFQNALYNERVASAGNPADIGAAAAQQALIESILGIYSGSPKSALTNPQTYGQNYGGVATRPAVGHEGYVTPLPRQYELGTSGLDQYNIYD